MLSFWKSSTAFLALLTLVLSLSMGFMVSHKHHTVSDRLPSSLDLINPIVLVQGAQKLLRDSGAKVVVLWAADIEVNARTVVFAHDASYGLVTHLVGYTDQIYSSNKTMNVFMTQIMAGTLDCGQVNTASRVGQYVAAVGAPSICRQGILVNGALVGYISLSYATVPTDEERGRVGEMLKKLMPAILKPR